jgi:hypothetical protein
MNGKTETWKRSEFTIAINPRAYPVDPGKRDGYIRGPFGIAKGTWGTWDITHLPSGLKVCEVARSFREAKAIVDQLLPILDWTQAEVPQLMTEEARQAIRQIVLKRP